MCLVSPPSCSRLLRLIHAIFKRTDTYQVDVPRTQRVNKSYAWALIHITSLFLTYAPRSVRSAIFGFFFFSFHQFSPQYYPTFLSFHPVLERTCLTIFLFYSYNFRFSFRFLVSPTGQFSTTVHVREHLSNNAFFFRIHVIYGGKIC